MKTSFVATIFNEEKTINNFIESINAQTVKPNEIILVDGGSTDSTVEKIKKYRNVKLLSLKANRSKARNYGIAKARGDIILVSDAGCMLEDNWIQNITEPFRDKSIDVVSGYYLPETHSVFEKCLATYTCVMPDRVDPENFLPSSRSVAFKKSAWKEIRGYPEYLDTCEDLVFAKELRKNGYHFFFAGDAIVYWRQKKNIIAAFKQFYGYSVGDGMAHYFRLQTPILFFRYIFVVFLILFTLVSRNSFLCVFILSLLIIYISWSIIKNYRYVDDKTALIYLPLLQFTADFAVLFGTAFGYIKRIKISTDLDAI